MFFCYSARMINTITPKEAFDAFAKGETVSLDVRSEGEYVSGHIKGALNIDFYDPSFEEEIKKLDTSKNYIVNCLSGGRSGSTVSFMEDLGFKNVKNLTGGISAWRSEGLPLD